MKLLITGALDINEKEIKFIEDIGYDVTFLRDELKKVDFEVSEFEAVICNALFLHNDINEFNSLKFIQVTSSGIDRLPMSIINSRKIKVYNANGVYSIPIAEWTVLKILEIFKDSKKLYENQSNRIWSKSRNIDEIYGKTASIIGYGSIGTEISKRLKPFGLNIINVGRNDKSDDYSSKYINIKNLDKAVFKSDIVIICLPLSKDTYKLFNKNIFKFFKKNSVLINISRGEVIDQKDLLNFVDKGIFKGVALDVFEQEPLSPKDVIWDTDIIVTPHNAFVSKGNRERLLSLIYYNLTEIKEGIRQK